jgi:PBSX family phage portal protein
VSETDNNQRHISPRPGTGTSYKFSAVENKNSYTKLYFNSIDSKSIKDPFVKYYRTSEKGIEIIKPPLNPYSLVKIIQENSFLQQCIDAMVTNTHGFGYRLEFIGKDDDETAPEALKELQHLEEICEQPNTYMPFQELRERFAWDFYVFGNAFLEVTRDSKGRVATIHHLPASTVRVTKIDTVATPTLETLMREGKLVSVKTNKYFRKFVQLDELGNVVHFKEFGDPRLIDPKTGKENTSITLDNSATEVIHFAKYNSQSVYGIPSWYSQMPSILGSRQAELTNLDFFENNAVPALAILVSGGYLTEEAFDFLRNNFESVKGRGSTNKVLVIEARGAVEDSSATGQVPTPTIQMKPLYAERQNDALFQEYEISAEEKIRSSFRLPPVFVGAAKDYTYASAKVSLEVAENQIFIPERVKFDDIMNNRILSTWKPKFFRFRSNPAALVTSEDILKSIEVFNDTGSMTPNIAIGILNEKMNLDIPRIKEFWGDMPFKMVDSILRAQGGPDKTMFLVNALEALNMKTVEELKGLNITPPPNTTILENVTITPEGNTSTKTVTTDNAPTPEGHANG